jgi:hypothetical protein
MKPTEEFQMMLSLIQLGYKVDAKVIQEKFGIQVQNPGEAAPLFPDEQEQKSSDSPDV